MDLQTSTSKTVRHGLVLSMFAGLAIAAGCGPSGPPMGTAAGKLTIGGTTPAEPTRVTFVNNSIGQGAGATVASDGSYSLEAPVPPAEYKVFVSKVMSDNQGPVSTAKEMLTTVPKEYRSEETSPLKFQIKEGDNEINIEIPAAPAAK